MQYRLAIHTVPHENKLIQFASKLGAAGLVALLGSAEDVAGSAALSTYLGV
jgi:hypothetical protein